MLKLLCGVGVLLTLATLTGWILQRRAKGDASRKVIENLNARIRAWWMMVAIFGVALMIGRIGSVVLFSLTSFLALREFITLTPTARGDHRTLFWAFFIILPLHYWLVARQWYGMFVIFIPVYAFLFIPIRQALAGDARNFLARTAMIQWGLVICVYCVSHAPALMMLHLPGFEGKGAQLLFFLVTVVQLSDVLQYVWGKLFGKRKIAPVLSPSKTLEGLVGGVLSASAVGAALWWITPFAPWQAALMALAITLMGFFGGLVMSAIKRDRGVKDWSALIEGHGGMMDRIDSLCFAAPIFFHLTRYFFSN